MRKATRNPVRVYMSLDMRVHGRLRVHECVALRAPDQAQKKETVLRGSAQRDGYAAGAFERAETATIGVRSYDGNGNIREHIHEHAGWAGADKSQNRARRR